MVLKGAGDRRRVGSVPRAGARGSDPRPRKTGVAGSGRQGLVAGRRGPESGARRAQIGLERVL